MAAPMRPGEIVTLDVQGLSLDGAGLATHEDREISVHGAFPGERVEARIEHVARQTPRASAKSLRSIVAHPSRGASPCPDDVTNGGRCTGCPLGALGVGAQRDMKRSMLSTKFGLAVESVIGGEPWGYRASSKRIAFKHGPRVALGSYVRGSHYAASMQHCRVEHPRIAEAAREIERVATALEVEPYDEKKQTGTLRAAWFKTDGDRVLVTLVVTMDHVKIRLLAKQLTIPVGVSMAITRKGSNDLRGTDVETLVGATHIDATLAGEKLVVGPLGFLQPNPAIAEQAYADLTRDTSGVPREGELALDLYAGAGVTTRLLRKRFARVEACESYPESAAALGVPPTTALAFLDAFRAKQAGVSPALVVANPPRAGLGLGVCDALIAIAPAAITMMSCHPGTLADDLARLAAGGFRLVKSLAYDTLPQTPHVEMVVWLERA